VPFSGATSPQTTSAPAILTASRADGVAATLSIPFTVTQ
jgi:hypothetical protein